ncbi:MAG: CocE/NonD family hydrolase [Deltaproteobacteria bacterium]|nr:CocE/NonD family hydrolase [Deltaproteobacteria bacterium]
MLNSVLRRHGALAVLTMLPLLAACGSDNDNNNKPTPTRTATQVATATSTIAVPTDTATVVPPSATVTFTPTNAPTRTATTAPTNTATFAPTDTPVATATATHTLPPSTPTVTFTPTGIPTGTATATVTPTGIPTGTATATYTPTGIPTGTATATVTPTPTSGPEGFRDVGSALPADFSAHGSVGQIYILDAHEGETLELVGADDYVVQAGVVDEFGALIFRDVPVGGDYHVVRGFPGTLYASAALASTAADAPPPQEFYESQQLVGGYQYITTRDGTKLAANIILPGPVDGGPYPTVIEYSGYDPSNPDSPQPSSLITSLLGYAVVGVNMRGTGCSGGAFQFFETLQLTDGYDIVETVAAQPWAANHKVGLVGLSYPGISQLFVAQLQPPSLAAIAPLSVISDTGRGTLYPGGILNNGFATDWAADRKHDAQPFGQGYSRKRRDQGDQVCIDNQQLRLQSPDILQMIEDNMFYIPAVADPASPATFVHKIDVPVFLAGAYQDEQVGGYFPNMLDQFTGTDKKHFTLVNGGHTEPLMPEIFSRWMEFLSFYVRREVPATPPIATLIAGFLATDIFKTAEPLFLPPDRFTGMSYEEALAAFESEPPVRVLFESGAGGTEPGTPVAAFEHSFDAWPIPGTVATPWYFGPEGTLTSEPPTESGSDVFNYSTADIQRTSFVGSGDDIWSALPNWQWFPLADGRAVACASEPLESDTVMIGTGSVDLWIRASLPDVDLQVALTEIRPDGQEVYIQNGWLRASRRKLDEEHSTVLRPLPTHKQVDAAPLPDDDSFEPLRIELFPFAHAFRAGSRIRISVSAPGGDRPLWKFRTPEVDDPATVEIARDADHPSRVVLPVVPNVDVPTGLPPCPGLRGQPCRPYPAPPTED